MAMNSDIISCPDAGEMIREAIIDRILTTKYFRFIRRFGYFTGVEDTKKVKA